MIFSFSFISSAEIALAKENCSSRREAYIHTTHIRTNVVLSIASLKDIHSAGGILVYKGNVINISSEPGLGIEAK